MGEFIWHQWSRFVSISATIYAIWASFFGFFYRKFFWDFVGGTLRDPGGLQPSKNVAFFITVIVKVPVVQILAMILGFVILALEMPLPMLKQYSFYRSFMLRIVLHLLEAFLTVLFYQGTNAALWSIITALCYSRAISLGESMAEAKQNRGRDGPA
ncbi:hypothetical protein CPB84DRAFT_1767160 [Gymnopilus junonius]|uniref:DUF7727 domain-containing protein n=1 Tax=Gymnopilus junonius TaxID=109634 RepID=A0A9P5NTL7_GYMJU|nr:hypothetical protein CPB84DRAFT_1767160 [Gymnopilus junonius]